MVGRTPPHPCALPTKPLLPLDYGFVEFSRQRVRDPPDPTCPCFPIFLTRCSGCIGLASDTLDDLPKSDVTLQVVLETYFTRPFLGCGTSFTHQCDSAGAVTDRFPDLVVEYARPRRDAMAVRDDSPDSADTAKSPPPRSPPTRGRWAASLIPQEIKGTLTLDPRLAPCNARLRYPIVVSNLSRKTRWQVRVSSASTRSA